MHNPSPNSLHPVMAGILNQHASVPMLAASLAMAADMQEIVDGLKARRAAQQAATAHYVPMAAEALADKRARLEVELAAARMGFDEQYQYCDDYSEWAMQSAKAAAIQRCERDLRVLA